jgi:tetratricopeptide (TPR) repeat protein
MKKYRYRESLPDLLMSSSAVVFLLVYSFAVAAQEDFEKGRQLFEKGQLAAAQQFFESVMKGDPQHAEAAWYLGRICFVGEEYDQAIAWFEKAVQIDGANAAYHLWLGRGYGYRAMRASVWRQFFLARKVRAHFERAVELDPHNVEARADLMAYYLKAPGILGGSLEKARSQAEEIKKRDAERGREAAEMIAEAEGHSVQPKSD